MQICNQNLLHAQLKSTADLLSIIRDYFILFRISYKRNLTVCIILYLDSCISLIILRFNLDIVCISSSLYFCWVVFIICMYQALLLHYPLGGHLCCFQFLTVLLCDHSDFNRNIISFVFDKYDSGKYVKCDFSWLYKKSLYAFTWPPAIYEL